MRVVIRAVIDDKLGIVEEDGQVLGSPQDLRERARAAGRGTRTEFAPGVIKPAWWDELVAHSGRT